MNKTKVIFTVAAALAVCAQARAKEWDQTDPVSGSIQSVEAAAEAMPSPAGRPVESAEPAASSSEQSAIAGVAVVDNRVYLSPISPLDVKDFRFELILNNTGDRVGANVSVCGVIRSATGKGAGRSMSCQPVVYRFPGLSYDPATKQVLSGGEVVARDRGFWHGGLKLEKEFKPEFKIVKSLVDRGFNRDTQLSIEVALARTAAR
jgi:hypothetical protein